MTQEGRLTRGKANYEAKVFLDNPETLEYVASLKPKAVEVKTDSKKEVKEKK